VLRDGAVKGVDVERALRNANALLAGSRSETASGGADEQTGFSTLSASFVVRDGVARSDDLDLRSDLIRLGGAGQIDVAAGTLDYTVRATVLGTLRGPDGREVTALRGATVPVTLSGPLEQPRYTIDWGEVAKEQLKARAVDALTRRQPAKPDDKPRESIEQRARDALKGLFGR
jgi:AsmA protein